MRCPKCGHSDDDECGVTFSEVAGLYVHDAGRDVWNFVQFGDAVLTLSGDPFDPTAMSSHKPTLWQRLKTWWRAWA